MGETRSGRGLSRAGRLVRAAGRERRRKGQRKHNAQQGYLSCRACTGNFFPSRFYRRHTTVPYGYHGGASEGVKAETPLAFPNMCWLLRIAPPILSRSVSNQQRVGPAASTGFGIVGHKVLLQSPPGYRSLELFEKPLPARLVSLVEVGEAGLVGHGVLPRSRLAQPHYATTNKDPPDPDLFRASLGIGGKVNGGSQRNAVRR